jgi:phage repressor protein C with HTH and peptisase S24 domain
MEMIERINEFIKSQGLSIRAVEQKISASNGLIRKAIANNTDIQCKWIAAIVENFPEINSEWLLTGKGEMLKTNKPAVCDGLPSSVEESFIKQGIPLIPVEAMAGYINGNAQQIINYDIKENFIITPELTGKGIKYLIRISGSSMTPKYNNGDLLACRPVTDISFMQWGKVYVLDTEQGPLVKRLYSCGDKEEDCLECRSDNYERYPPFKIRKKSIRMVAIVMAVLKLE